MEKTNHTSQETIPFLIQEPEHQFQSQNQLPISGKPKEFPVRKLKIFGSVQLGLAVFLVVLSINGIILDNKAHKQHCDDFLGWNMDHENGVLMDVDSYYQCWGRWEYYPQVLAFNITCLVFLGLYVVTGFLPLCMSRKRERSWGGLRMAFMVYSIVGASLFAPSMFILGGVREFQRGKYDKQVDVFSICIVVLSLAEMVVSIIAASYCCCCTPWKKINRIIYVQHQGMICTNPQFTIPMTTDQPNLFYSVGPHGNPIIVQYPNAQQYQVIVTNPHVMTTTKFDDEKKQAVADNRQEKVLFDFPAYQD